MRLSLLFALALLVGCTQQFEPATYYSAHLDTVQIYKNFEAVELRDADQADYEEVLLQFEATLETADDPVDLEIQLAAFVDAFKARHAEVHLTGVP